MSESFQITKNHERWAERAHRRRRKKSVQFWTELIKKQDGKCALTRAPLFFDRRSGTPQKGRLGCHPLYAAVDHITPRREDLGFQILCYDINDLKGHLPPPLFNALTQTKEWKRFSRTWKKLAGSFRDRRTLKKLIKAGAP